MLALALSLPLVVQWNEMGGHENVVLGGTVYEVLGLIVRSYLYQSSAYSLCRVVTYIVGPDSIALDRRDGIVALSALYWAERYVW
jgi:hypothetical protein